MSKELLQQVRAALVYHTEQTRPIQSTDVAIAELDKALAQPAMTNSPSHFERMFEAACVDLGLINEALGLDPDDGGAEPIL